MMPLLTKTLSSAKKELLLVLGVIITLFFLPVVAIASVTDIGSLADSAVRLYTGRASTKNTYFYGYCTFWAAQRRAEISKPIPNSWGDANTWDDRARADGYLVDQIPIVGAIMQSDAGDFGHVAFVEKVELDGTWKISEMNAKGWDILSDRTLTAAQAKKYKFIH